MSRIKLSEAEIENALKELIDWNVDGKLLKKHFDFENFRESLVFVNKVGEIAEKADHHPDITFGWGYADLILTTHDAGGLTQNDFDVADEIDGLSN